MSISNDAHRIASELHSVAILLVRVLRDQDRKSGLTAPQRSVLSRLINEGPHTLGQLAKAERVRPPTMTRLIQNLEHEGYVIRRTGEDKRVATVDYTSKAWTTLEQARTRRTNSLGDRVQKLSKTEQKQLQKVIPILKKLGETFDD